MRANELCMRTAERLVELGVGVIVAADELENVLYVAAPEPCIILCRARLHEKSAGILRRAGCVPVLLVKDEIDIERAAQLLSYTNTGEEADLFNSSLTLLWRLAR